VRMPGGAAQTYGMAFTGPFALYAGTNEASSSRGTGIGIETSNGASPWTRATGKRLRGALAEFQGAVDPRAITRRAAAHADFHATIAQSSGNRHVVAQIPMIRFTAQMGTRYVQNLDEDARSRALAGIEQGEGSHLAILQSIEGGDAGTAERAARLHIRETIETILRQRSEGARRPA